MAVEAGQQLHHYRIVEKIGEGGMGVVWKALDTVLDREVAIKLLPESVAADADRLARFEREAKLLASLNHPNIAAIYGLHRDGGTHFLVMELVEGEDLAERLQRGALPVDEALDAARQVAQALEAAHERGVVHRDLKPANVKRTPEGTIKVLDFGLAKAIAPDAASSTGDVALSPTMTSAGTQAGMILGTAAYMSPEQARGKKLDRRTDLWSFGCVLHECLTGTQMFRGETVSDSLAAILRKEPDWSKLPADTPPGIRWLLDRCLTRNPAKRLQDAGDARVEIEQAIEDPAAASSRFAPAVEAATPQPAARSWIPWSVAVAALLVAALLAWRGTGTDVESRGSRRLTIPVPGATQFGDDLASPPVISPDGRMVAFGVMEASGETRLWVRPLDDFVARPLPGTDGANYAFWSADSRHLGFFLGGKIKRVEVETGRVQAVGGEGSSFPRGGSWSARDQILFAPTSNTGIHLIGAAGGEIRQLTTPDPDVPDSSHRWPVFLPDGEHFLFVGWTNDLSEVEQFGGVYLGSIAGDAPPVRLVSDASSVAYSPSGHLLVLRGENLIAIPFDADAREVTGSATVIASGVLRSRASGHGSFSVSNEGSLVYASGKAFLPAALTWFDRDGNASESGLEPAAFLSVRLAPGGKRAVTVIPGESGDGQIWLLDLERGVRTRLASETWSYADPAWSSDGTRVIYASQEQGGMDFFERFADGSGAPRPVFVDGQDKELFDWSRDGKRIAYWPFGAGSGTPDLWLHSIEQGESRPLVEGNASYVEARFSPDGRWIVYVTDVSGSREVVVQELVGPGGLTGGARWQVSTSGGQSPHWSDDGREIVYVDPGRQVMAVSFDPRGPKPVLGTPQALFTIDDVIVTLDADGDHRRFFVATRDELDSEPLHVVLDWTAR